jgi:hypothetical protein
MGVDLVREPDASGDYAERGVRATHSALVDVGQVLGEYRDAVVLVGGGVPALRLPQAKPPHIGTLDIDLDLDVELLAAGRYAELVELLERAGWCRHDPVESEDGLKPFQLRKDVVIDDLDPVPVVLDLLMPRDAKPEKNRPKLIEGLRVQRCDGADVALRHCGEIEISGQMPDGRMNTVRFRVATLPACLVMKGYALDGRDKKKDAYDIWFCARFFPGGPAALADECKPLLEDPGAHEGLRRIAAKFKGIDDFGPVTVRRFLEGSHLMGGMTPDQVQEDAFRQVEALLASLGFSRAKEADA